MKMSQQYVLVKLSSLKQLFIFRLKKLKRSILKRILRKKILEPLLKDKLTIVSENFLYEKIKLEEDIEIYFNKIACETDVRGIGRVSRKLLSELKKYEVKNTSHKELSVKKVYFYSSIHLCEKNLPKPSVVLVHDVIPLIFKNHFKHLDTHHLWYTPQFKRNLQEATRIVTISHSSAKDISENLGVPLEKITVIYNGLDPMVSDCNTFLQITTSPFILYIGDFSDYHKNIQIILNSLNDPRLKEFKLVIVSSSSSVKNFFHNHSYSLVKDKIHVLKNLSDSLLAYVISKASALVCPSLYEGFGLPILEAISLGTPAICSKRPAMTELFHDAVMFVDPFSSDEWVEAIIKINTDLVFKEKLISRAKKVASQYNWNATTKRLIKVLKEAASS